MYYYGARYYHPGLGHFVQPDTLVPDPSNPQTLNRYAYVNNNPVTYNDPSGHCGPCVLGMGVDALLYGGLALVFGTATAAAVLDLHVGGPRVQPDVQFPDLDFQLRPWAAQALGRQSPAGSAAGVDVGGQTALPPAPEDPRRNPGHGASAVGAASDPEVLAAEKLVSRGLDSPESGTLIKAIAQGSTRGELNGTTVLGHFPQYVDVGKVSGTYFDMSSDIYEILEERNGLTWEVNKQFLDDAIARGDRFLLANELRDGPSAFRQELQYLARQGYSEVVEDGTHYMEKLP